MQTATLYELFAGQQAQIGFPDVPVREVTGDSRRVQPGSLFVALRGLRTDGHDHAAEALKAGAVAVVLERDLGLERQILVPDTRSAYALLCAAFCGDPQRDLALIGVTGTNGKTTVTTLLKGTLEALGKKAGLLGTIENRIGEVAIPAKYTTPDPSILFGMLARMRAAGCVYGVMEVSSHGLEQRRVEGCRFRVGVFTNLTQDHLDYHGDMESYYQAKKSLFELCGSAVVNLDDPYGARLAKELTIPVRTISVASNVADYTAKDIRSNAAGSSFAFVGRELIARVRTATPGEFSVHNAMCVLAVCLELGLPLAESAAALSRCPGVPGRLEVLDTSLGFTVLRDYAHTPDALEQALKTMRPLTKGRLLVLFGCAGERDRAKRRFMTEAVVRYADSIILTSDNPRSEPPEQIIGDAALGFGKNSPPHVQITDRFEAIRHAMREARPGDVLLLCGKGHEDYQVLDFGTVAFDEAGIVRRVAAEIAVER